MHRGQRFGVAAAGQAVFIFLVMWTVITFIFTLASLGTNWTVLVTFIVFDIAFILADIGAAKNGTGVTQAAGWVEMLLAALAWYIVMAEIVNATLGRTIFPLFPFRKQDQAAIDRVQVQLPRHAAET